MHSADISSVVSPGKKTPVVLLGFRGASDALAGRLILLGFRPLKAEDAGEALELVEGSASPIRGALFPVSEARDRLVRTLEQVRKKMPMMELVAVGDRPSDALQRELRGDGVRFCLFEPTDDSALRFVLNQALYDRTRGETRDELRVPTTLMARVSSGTGTRVALVYNLSNGGAYLETHRPMMKGAFASVILPFPERELEARVRVVSANVTGNLQRPNLPLGMGVRFEAVSPEDHQLLTRYVEDRAAEFRL